MSLAERGHVDRHKHLNDYYSACLHFQVNPCHFLFILIPISFSTS